MCRNFCVLEMSNTFTLNRVTVLCLLLHKSSTLMLYMFATVLCVAVCCCCALWCIVAAETIMTSYVQICGGIPHLYDTLNKII